MPSLILLTCASGKQSSHLIPHLYSQPDQYTLRLAVNSASSLSRLQTLYPNAETIRADLLSPATCHSLVHNVSTIHHIGPPLHPHEAQIGKNMIDAARREQDRKGSKLKHLILSSVIHPEVSKLLNHECKREVEAYLLESGVKGGTVVQPSHFLDNSIPQMRRLRDEVGRAGEGRLVWRAPHRRDVEFCFSCGRDVGEVTARIVAEGERHFYATYQVVSTGPTTYEEFVKVVGEVLGREVVVEGMRVEEAVELFLGTRASQGGDTVVGERVRDGVERLVMYYNRRGLLGNTNVLEMLLGRQPTSVREFVESVIGE